MKKLMSLFMVLLVGTTFTLSNTSYAETPITKGEGKGGSADFYLELSSKLQSYFESIEKGEITEEKFKSLVEENIASQLQTEEDEKALLESESRVDSPNKIVGPEQPQKGSIYDYFGKFGYKGTEVSLCAKNPLDCREAQKLAEKALKDAQDRYSDYTLWQGNGDAFRHAYWCALMTKHISRTFAWKMGYAHEGYATGTYDKIGNLDSKMDVRNNHLGRIDGTNYKKYKDGVIADKIADSVSSGKKVRIRTYTKTRPAEWMGGVPTKYQGKFVKTSDGGRQY
ncbi:DUF6973 domain-containing protein [Mechercharimyces sp. CAU 1602]|uniref:DUF6973 domain-containing protein n=1 Tax=Mechercharimyces sp. CAU 1602 TaxID=2973933 RepID=UPI0021614EB7|nr:hypothetical protein [Mechercharimyces sp. CAU 1602]MCS1351702.1 hypothetical protein [Mechercharimyces sp. CAU 1602]